MIKEAIGTGLTVEEAKAAAMLELGLSEYDDFKVEVLKTPQKKFLGLFGSTPAEVKVSVETKEPAQPKEKAQKKEKPQKKEKAEKREKSEKTEQSAGKKADAQKEASPLTESNLYGETADYIKSVVKALGMAECEITEKTNEEEIFFELECGDDYGIIIGKRGETLDAIQYLARMIANKGKQNYKRVSINVGNYREKREETIRALAKKTAFKAVRLGKSISLEPMNPYERRIIHTAVQEVEGATSHSVGSDLDRRVVITPVEGAKNGSYSRNPRGGRSGGRGPRREKREAYKPEIAPDRAPKSDMDGSSLYGKIEIKATAEKTEE